MCPLCSRMAATGNTRAEAPIPRQHRHVTHGVFPSKEIGPWWTGSFLLYSGQDPGDPHKLENTRNSPPRKGRFS